jgi:HK97 gp10 family phage protein
MKSFSSPAAFAAFLPALALEVKHEEHKVLEKAAVVVETEAKRVIGTYDYGWTPLAESTLAKKSADTPLLETGEMRDSIEHTVHGNEAEIGSNNDKALWQEYGTSRIPPRSFLGGALTHKEAEIVKMIGQDIVKVIEGKKS